MSIFDEKKKKDFWNSAYPNIDGTKEEDFDVAASLRKAIIIDGKEKTNSSSDVFDRQELQIQMEDRKDEKN